MPFTALLLALMPVARAPIAARQLPIDAKQATEQILERGNYQRELPLGGGPGSTAFDSSGDSGAGDSSEGAKGAGTDTDQRRAVRRREEDAAGGRTRRPESRQGSSGGNMALPAELAQAVGWVMLAALVVGVVVWLARMRGGRNVRLREDGAAEPAPPIAYRFDAQPLEDAERLAREGRFAEAIRALLLQTFQALRGREGVRLEPWLTSREVLAAARLSDAHRTSLARLVDAVERSLFARRVPGAEEFEACAREYRALLDGDPGRA